MDEKPLCRWCGEPLRKTTREGKSGWRHADQDNGRCETLRRRITGDSQTVIEPA